MTAVKKGIAGQCHMIVSQAQVHFLRLNSLCSLLTKQCRSKVRFIGGEGGGGLLGGSGDTLPRKILNYRVSKIAFSALGERYFPAIFLC